MRRSSRHHGPFAGSNEEMFSMPHDHTYDCRICGAHLDSQQELNKHNRECHSAQAQTETSDARQPRSKSDLNDTPRNF
jgi:hypothetical protein